MLRPALVRLPVFASCGCGGLVDAGTVAVVAGVVDGVVVVVVDVAAVTVIVPCINA